MKIRRARTGEAVAVARLIRESLTPDIRGMTIWDSPGVEAYLEERLADEAGRASHVFYVAEADVAAGVAEFRVIDGDAFLNHIYVRPAHRTAGGGRALLARGVDEFTRDGGAARVCLDVAEENGPAKAWYDRLGFRKAGDRYWCVASLGEEDARPAHVEGLEEADRQHRRFGFSQIQLRLPESLLTVGRIGSRYFRLSEAALAEPRIRAALWRLDPRRSALLIVDHTVREARCVRHAERLACDAALLRGRLAGRDAAGRRS